MAQDKGTELGRWGRRLVLQCGWVAGILLVASVQACSYARPAPNRIDFDSQGKANAVQVVISAGDLRKTEYCRFGILGILFPKGVKVGDCVKHYAEEYLEERFSTVQFVEQPTETSGPTVEFRLLQFSISAMQKQASATLGAVVKDARGEVLLEKEYSSEGEGHFPMYLNEYDQILQLCYTTEQALDTVFDEFWGDLQKIPASALR